MSALAERLSAIRVWARVPGTGIEAELRNRTELTLSFGPDGYPAADERMLQAHLAMLARLLYVGYLRQYRDTIADTAVLLDAPQDARDRFFLAARGDLESTGTSVDGRISISAVGMQNVSVTITDGTTRELTERQFIGGIREAFAALADRHTEKIDELKRRIYR